MTHTIGRWLVLVSLALGAVACGAVEDALEDAAGGGGFAGLYDGYFQECIDCHTPDGVGRTSDTEDSLDFSTKSTAHNTLTNGSASGLQGNQSACNLVPFVGSSPSTSLIVAVLDEDVRQTFDLPSHPGCDGSAVSDMTLKVGSGPSGGFLSDLKSWISDGTPND